jgi:diacylglycerol kinase
MNLLKVVYSFRAAFRGAYLVSKERNMRFHILASLAVFSAGLFFGINKTEWILVLLCIALVISLEAVNTAIELIMNFIHPEKHEAVRDIKDIAAAAVLVVAAIAAICGAIIFAPYVLNLFLLSAF